VRQSELAEGISARNVLNRILDIPVSLTVGEILGVLKELAGLLAELIKPKMSNRKGIDLGNDLPVRNGFAAERFRIAEISVKVVLKGNGSKGLRPQLVRCAPFPSIAPYCRML